MPSLFHSISNEDLFNFDQEFDLFPNAEIKSSMHFMWSDSQEFCQYFRERILQDSALAKLYESKIQEISLLKTIPVWMKIGSKIFTSHLYEIYDSHLHQKTIFQHDQSIPLEISFISPSGPFKKMAITDCLNIQSYQDFVFLSILNNKLPLREFRLRFSSRLLFESGPQFEQTLLGDLCQMTSKGMLLKMKSDDLIKGQKNSSKLRLLMNTRILDTVGECKSWTELKAQVETWPTHPLYTQNKLDSFVLNANNLHLSQRFDFARTNDVYTFVSFELLKESNQVMVKKLEKFVNRAKTCINNSLIPKSA